MGIVAVLIGGTFGTLAAAISVMVFGAGLGGALQSYLMFGTLSATSIVAFGLVAQRGAPLLRDWENDAAPLA